MTTSSERKPASTELTGGAGFTYEDTVVAYYLTQLLRRERASGQSGFVKSVAVQRQGFGHPMDDLIIEFDDQGTRRTLDIQIKRSVTISSAASNEEFRGIISDAVKTQASATFTKGLDKCGFVVEHVTTETFRSFVRLIDWATSSTTGTEFETRFTAQGNAGKDEQSLRTALRPLLGGPSSDDEVSFYQHFAALSLNGLGEGGALRAEIISRLQEIIVSNVDGQDILLFDRLCRVAREGSATAKKWDRASLIGQLRGAVRLSVIPFLKDDIARLNAYSLEGLSVVLETVGDIHVNRDGLHQDVLKSLARHRVVSIGGLPGCGKSVVLKRCAQAAAVAGPIIFLKNDRIACTGWSTFAASLGLSNTDIVSLLQEVGSAGTPVLFIDGIDRIRPDQQGLVMDFLSAIHNSPSLSAWNILVSSRDQGLEAFRAWFPSAMYAEAGIGDVTVKPFSNEEAEQLAQSKPHLRRLLFGPPSVRDIARRPFFAAALDRSAIGEHEPQTEVDLIATWWARAGHDVVTDATPKRQRALIDIAENGVRNLGKGISTRALKDSTIDQIAALKTDKIIREERGGSLLTFSHDIFFEWAFFRLLIDLGDDWTSALTSAGEPPLLGRVVGLMAQDAVTENGRWQAGYRSLVSKQLRRQWHREWLTSPPFTPAFHARKNEFTKLLKSDDFALFEKVLVWFQAQHTIPSPVILGNLKAPIAGIDNLEIADLLGWPSDFAAWGRLLDWLISEAGSLPVRLIPKALQIFDVWQNCLSDHQNHRSQAFLSIVDGWLKRFENGALRDNSSAGHKASHTFSSDEGSRLGTSLRTLLLRSARSYPEFSKELFKRNIASKEMRRRAYSDLVAFSAVMCEVDADLVADLAEAELLNELPDDKRRRSEAERQKQAERLARIRAIPEHERTQQQVAALQHAFLPIGSNRYSLDDIGIDAHHHFYYPTSALHEPFKSLFEHRPAVALRLVRNLANHATKGWKQTHIINRGTLGTPLPVTVRFPWGDQDFWGDWRVYSWGMGQLTSTPLECAFLALSYWAFKEIEKGRTASAVIRDLVEGNDCYAVLGLALLLALETWEVTDTTFAVATTQRLWEHDIARLVHHPTLDIDILGFGGPPGLTGMKAEAKRFLDQRLCWKREVRQLAMRFALSNDDQLSSRFKAALELFQENLPYQFEEQQTNEACRADLLTAAKRWSGLGDAQNYKHTPHSETVVAVTYQPPEPLLSKAEQQKLEESSAMLRDMSVVSWATKSLEANAVGKEFTISQAAAYAKSLDVKHAFATLEGSMSPQCVIANVAACVIRFCKTNDDHYKWAWEVMSKIEAMKPAEGTHPGSKIPWHPATRLIISLHHDRRSDSPRADSAERLLNLVLHPLDSVSELALDALFMDRDEHLRWCAGCLSVNLSVMHEGKFHKHQWDYSSDHKARRGHLATAIKTFKKQTLSPMPTLPPAWTQTDAKRRARDPEDLWQQPSIFFEPKTASTLLSKMPVEAWMTSSVYRPLLEPLIFELVTWTSERITPPWQTDHRRRDRDSDLFEWNRALGDLLARTAPFFALDQARDKLLKPFMRNDDNSLAIIARFADMAVRRHICDNKQIPENAISLLDDCVSRVINDNIFDPGSWQPGQVNGHGMPELINALLFVNVEKQAPGACRFANGDWSQIATVMPIIDRLVRHVGWSSYVMGRYLELCIRAGAAFPVSYFGQQATAALRCIDNAEERWIGTSLPARLAGVIQRQADWNFPLRQDDAQALLNALDVLIDQGDRRAAALEQTEAFKGVQA
ncbi:AAA family ATPase [Pseudomonas syringae group sp. J309-1]|uniref:AAA family ATPase n=1 Tax=Pseudomonas syringae group sp. J309-1 TaxID=3079588 RepID=UPI002908055B|nr:AAA family ATPase [Pseudomonas syringae group sp. J309-1]MDU8357644.1 AAA family ATPase [Pseudomonas syringae group sp. J309-1]